VRRAAVIREVAAADVYAAVLDVLKRREEGGEGKGEGEGKEKERGRKGGREGGRVG
jgi:hypothetical protein